MNFSATTRIRVLALIALSSGAGSAAAVDTFFDYTNYGCVPRAMGETFTSMSETRQVSWYGDSRTTSNCRYTNPTTGATEYSTHQASLARRGTPEYLSVRQRGRDGTSLRQLEAGQDTVNIEAPWNDGQKNQSWAGQMAADQSDIVVIAHGTNDVWQNRLWNTGEGVADFEARLERMVNVAKSSRTRSGGYKKVLLVQPFRVCSYAMVDRETRALRSTLAAPLDGRTVLDHPDNLLAPYAEAVSRVGIRTGTHVAPLFSVPIKCNGEFAKADLPDGLHATAAYTGILGEVIKTSVQRIVDNVPSTAVPPRLTLLRAPLQQLTDAQMTFGSGRFDYPNIMPAAGQDYQILVQGTGLNNKPILQLSNWVSSNASSVAVSCTISIPFQQDNTVAWSNLNAINLGLPGPMPALSGWDCRWTATGPTGATFVAPETFFIHPQSAAGAPTLTLARSPMPLIAGQPFRTTWRAENAETLSRVCTANGSGYASPAQNMPLNSHSASAKNIVGSFADVNSVETASAELAWIGNPTTCIWTVYGPGGSTSYYESFHTVAR